MNLKKVFLCLIAMGLVSASARGVYTYAHNGVNGGNIQAYNYIVDSSNGATSSGFLRKIHNTSAINGATSIGGNKAIYARGRYIDGDKNMITITSERQLKAGNRTELPYLKNAAWYYGHDTDMKFKSGSTVFVDVQVKGSWSPDDKHSKCTM